VLQSNAFLANDFRDCIECLNARQVVFVLVGGYAVGWHGVVRATGDIDFLYHQTKSNVARLCSALRDFGAPEHLIDPAFLMSPNAVTQIGDQPLRIDLLAAITGIAFDDVRAGADEVELDGQRLLVIGINELRINKGATGRAKDKEDLRRLGTATGGPSRSKKSAPKKGAARPRRRPPKDS
jgi:predicted nucleotidyltransferase